MAEVALAAAAAVTWVTGAVASTGALVATSLSVYTGISIGTAVAVTNALGSLALNAAMAGVSSLLFAPNVERGGSPLTFKADPAAPISGVMGRFGVAGRQVHANTWGKDNLYMSFVVALSLGPIQSYETFTANTVAVTFPGAQGLAASFEPYKDKMWQTRRLGLPTDAFLTIPTGVPDGSPGGGGVPFGEWTSAHTLPGIAHTLWTLKNNSKRASYESGVPGPLWTLHGMKLWDPRLDSTYPGGSGSQRRSDWTTWGYTASPYLHALAWARGHFKLNTNGTIDRTKRIAGVGAPDGSVDIAAFVEGANVADANNWTVSGEWTTVDDKWHVLAAMLQAGGGAPLNRGAKISCTVEAPRASILTLTGADIVGSASLNVMASRRDRPNTIIPRCRLEAQRFEEVALGAVTASTYLAEDGGETRTREIPFRYVGEAKQGAELAAYGLANARETLLASFPCKPHLLALRAGDAFAVQSPEHGLNGQKFVVLKRTYDPSSDIVTIDARSETEAKHAWALGQTANPPPTPALTSRSPIPETPLDADWTVAVRPAEAGGVQQPGVIVSGTAEDNIGAILIEVGGSNGGPWEQVYEGPPTTAQVAINGLVGGQTYFVAITYYSLQGVPSDQLVKGPFTAPSLVAATIAGQSILATNPDFAGVTGATRPANNATVGARMGTNLFGTNGTTQFGQAQVVTDEGMSNTYRDQTAWGTYSAHLPGNIAPRVASGLDASGDLSRNLTTARRNSSNLLGRTSGGLYNGALDAGTTLSLFANTPANIAIQGNTVTKTGGGNAWDGGGTVWSRERFVNGASVSGRVIVGAMLGMASSATPTAPGSTSFAAIHYAFHPSSDGNLYIFESGTIAGTFGTYAASTFLKIDYDGVNVRYYKDGVLQRTVFAGRDRSYYLQGDILDVGSALLDLRIDAFAGAASIDKLWNTTGTTQFGQAQVVTDESPRVQYVNDGGRVIDGRGLPLNGFMDASTSTVGFPVQSDPADIRTRIEVLSHTRTITGGQTIVVPAGNITGLSQDTRHFVYRDIINGSFVASTSGANNTSAAQFLFLGTHRTADAAFLYTPPPPPPAGGETMVQAPP